MKRPFFVFIFCLLICACSSNDPDTQENKTPEATTSEPMNQYPAPFFEIENYTDSLGNPRSIVNLNVSKKKLKITEVMNCEKIEPADYQQYQIPKEAIDACGGWWAGAGDYFYLISNGEDNYTVMQGEMHEDKTTKNYDYKMVMNLSNKMIPRSDE